jgi:uroporphyrinogen-III decarboxylase
MSKNRRWAPRARCVGRSGTPWTKACQMCQESQWASATDILSQQEPWSCLLIITGYMIYWLIRGYTDHVYWLEDILIMFDHEKNHQNSSNPQKWNRKHQKKLISILCSAIFYLHLEMLYQPKIKGSVTNYRSSAKKQYPPNMGWFKFW